MNIPNGLIPQGDEYQVNTHTDDAQNRPLTTALADGGYVIIWDSKEQDEPSESGYGVYGQRFNANGGTVGAEFQINTFTLKRAVGTKCHSAERWRVCGNLVFRR